MSARGSSCTGEHCTTCSDEALAMSVVRVDAERGLALCEDEHGARASVETALVAPLSAGDRVLVHAGVAIAALAGPAGPAAAGPTRVGTRAVLAS